MGNMGINNSFLTKLQNQTNAKHSSNPKDIFKSAKKFFRKLYPKGDSSKTTMFKVLSKFLNRAKTLKQQYHLCQTKIFVEVMACREVLTSQIISYNPASVNIFKPIPVLKDYSSLFSELFNSLPSPSLPCS